MKNLTAAAYACILTLGLIACASNPVDSGEAGPVLEHYTAEEIKAEASALLIDRRAY